MLGCLALWRIGLVLCMRQMGMLCLAAWVSILGSSVAAETSLISFAPARIAAEATHEDVVSIEMIGVWFRCGNLFSPG